MKNTTKAANEIREALKPTFFKNIPLNMIGEILANNGLQLIDEDGSAWEGMLLGENSRTNIQVGEVSGKPTNKWLALSWYRMGSGNFEIVGYLN